MCFDHDSVPPIEEGGRAIQTADLVLTAGDGNQFAAFEAVGAEPSRAAVVVLPDVRGLFQFYKDLAARLAQAGHDSVAIDYFGRTAGITDRPNEWDFRPHVEATTLAGVAADTAAAITLMRDRNPGYSVFTLGFCFGGSGSWHQAASGHGLAGAIGFYGRPSRPTDEVPVMDRIDDIDCPIMALMGGADEGIPQSEVDAFEEALNAAGVPNQVITYPGAPHSFFDRKYDEYADVSADAWSRVLEFIGRHTK